MKSHRTKSALTREDVAWLEQRLSSAMVPVQPRAQFIQDAKRAMLDGVGDDDEPPATPWIALLSGALFTAGLVLLLVALVRRKS